MRFSFKCASVCENVSLNFPVFCTRDTSVNVLFNEKDVYVCSYGTESIHLLTVLCKSLYRVKTTREVFVIKKMEESEMLSQSTYNTQNHIYFHH